MSHADLALMRRGTQGFLDLAASLSDLNAPSALPSWSRKHLLAHVTANALALGRLVTWARTGVEHPMYPSTQARAEEIAEGAEAPSWLLRAALHGSAAQLDTDYARLDAEQRRFTVTTAQGRALPASAVLWLRCREVFIHQVDLDAGVTFADFPETFLKRLVTEVVAARGARRDEPRVLLHALDHGGCWSIGDAAERTEVVASLADLAAWLTGRPTSTAAPDLPPLPAWL